MVKEYVKVELKAKNAPRGSYAAGCPQYMSGVGTEHDHGPGNPDSSCRYCECAK